MYSSVEEKDNVRKAIRIAKQRNKEPQDVNPAKQVKDSAGQRRGRMDKGEMEILFGTVHESGKEEC